jgi:hypothetical protein
VDPDEPVKNARKHDEVAVSNVLLFDTSLGPVRKKCRRAELLSKRSRVILLASCHESALARPFWKEAAVRI